MGMVLLFQATEGRPEAVSRNRINQRVPQFQKSISGVNKIYIIDILLF
jgi:hypothetical protein